MRPAPVYEPTILHTIDRFGTKRVKANTVYQEFIQDKHHQHMNSTRWVTLTEFVKHLGRTGVARVDETEKGWFMAWIDSSPKALEKQVIDPALGSNFTDRLSRCRRLHLRRNARQCRMNSVNVC